MRNLVLIAVYLFGANAFAMTPADSRKDMIVTKKIGNEDRCLEIASLTESTIKHKLNLDADSEFSIKCLPYKNIQNTYALVANVDKNTKKVNLSFSLLSGMKYEIQFARREQRPRAMAVEDHIIQNGEVIIKLSSKEVDYSVLVPFKKEYNMVSGTDVVGQIKRDIDQYGKDSNILGIVHSYSSVLKSTAILIHIGSDK